MIEDDRPVRAGHRAPRVAVGSWSDRQEDGRYLSLGDRLMRRLNGAALGGTLLTS